MLRRYVEQILSIYNYIDGVLVTNNKGIIEYYTNFRQDINNLEEKDAIGKHVLTVYPTLTEETSSVMRALKTGKSIFNEFQSLVSYKGQTINAINSTLLVKHNEDIIGVVDVSRYVDDCYQRQDIVLSIKNNEQKKSLYTVDDIITNSPALDNIKEKIKKVAQTDSTVLIYGETGTGKELVAQSIHTSSNRKNKRFVSQNCASIPSTLLESILFGTTKGSYTGAEN
ncbi:MAG TPA: sigma-54-dependent Fis family transcriptional regulator, partial [Clostridiales bacterium]|nr:sigma-54-dependent Fis family transcriptional regulator [Clostridiales bacterium]